MQKIVARIGESSYFALILLLVWMFAAGKTTAFAQSQEVYLSIQAGGSSLIGIGVEGFTAAGATSVGISAPAIVQVRETLLNDVAQSGVFTVKTTADSVQGDVFSRWRASGARCYLFGEIGKNGDTVVVNAIDLRTSMTVLNEEYRILRDKPWYTAHIIVDDLIEVFTGKRGSMTSQLAFITPIRGVSNEIYVMDADGRGRRQVTYTKTLNLSPSWSSDGSSISFSSLLDGVWSIMAVNTNTGQSQRVSRAGGLNSAPCFSPVDPGLLAFTSTRDGNGEIYTCRTNGSDVKRLTKSPGIDSSPSWSPDGSQITFTSDRNGQPAVYIMNADGSNAHRLTSSISAYEDSPCWSPRGDRIAFVILFDRTFDIATASPNGDDVVIITSGQGSNENPRWSPDGLRILFSSTRDGGKDLYIMNADGSNVRRLTTDGSSYSPSWSPSSNGNDIRVSSRR